MKFIGDWPEIEINSIIVLRDTRQRRELKLDDLKDSIASRGLLHPIIIDESNTLVSGERRLESCRALGWSHIPFRRLAELSPVEAQIVELEENIKRQDLTWQDSVHAISRIHALYRELDLDWTMTETAEAIGMSLGNVSKYIRIKNEMTNERIATATSIPEAWNTILRADSRAKAEGLEELLIDYTEPEVRAKAEAELNLTGDLPRPVSKPLLNALLDPILNLSFLDWAPAYTGPKFNLIHCDFPYGIEVFSGPQARGSEPGPGYSDSLAMFQSLLECLCSNSNRLASSSAHLMFWCRLDGGQFENLVRQTFQRLAPSWSFSKFPLIWHKTDNSGIASEPRFWPRHVYETCLLASRGKRQIVKIVGDCYGCQTDKSLHVSTKPESMLKHFMTMLVDEHTTLLDPTAGSGAALRAAEALGARLVQGLEIDPQVCEIANRAIRSARFMRGTSVKANP